MIKVKAKIIKTLFSKDDYRIFGLSPLQHYEELELNNFHNFSIAGNYPYLEEGKEYELVIKKDSSSKYPATYIVDSVPSLTELDLNTLTREESFDILMQVTSSKTIANNLLDYDEHIIATLVNKGKEAVDLKQIKGVGEVYISAYERQLLDKYKYYYIAQRFKNYKLDICDCKNLINLFKTENEIENALKENPYYVLFMVLGKSFSFSDRIILEVRPELRDSDIRCEAIMIDILNRNEQEGSTRLNGNILWRILKEDYDACEDWGKNIKNIAQNSDLIYYDEDSKDLAIKNTYLIECRIADFIKYKLANPIHWDFEWEKFKKIKEGFLTDEQSLVLKKLCEESLVILNASAGCGKTSSMLAIIEMLEHYHKTYKCITATGKAAKRLSESINNRPTSTIHRACLGNNKISEDVLIIDEHSFLSVELMNMIINSIDNPDIKVLLIGDLEQIPNLSLGKPIRDIVDSGIMDICELTKCFRFGIGGVSTVSTIARQGRPYIKPNEYDNKPITIGQDKGYTFIPFENNMEQIISVYENIRKKKHLKPEDICVITAYNIREFGTINVNNAIQSVVNPPKPNEEVIVNEFVRNNCRYSIIFREGDIVMNTVNNYNAIPLESYEQYINDESGVLSLEDLSKVSCMNGEIGKILSVEEGIMKIQFDENIIVFDKNLANNLLLAYASNPYKMQGSQCKWIIMLTIPEQKKSLNRQLLYTTLTRAREGVIEIGDIQTQNNALSTEGDTYRSTWLLDLLKSND